VKALATKADVGSETDIKAAVDVAVKEFGRLDIMVNLSIDSYHRRLELLKISLVQ
jgi:NAD(P)-dependent dehydrogenase (short-subunit alcohol dehydrogenase family)